MARRDGRHRTYAPQGPPSAFPVQRVSSSRGFRVAGYLRPRTSSRTGLSPAAGLQAVHVGTLHGLKGLEYQRIILVGITDSAIPGARVEALQQSDPVRYRRELLRARSLLFVAATRARDSLVISWHGQPSRFLPSVP